MRELWKLGGILIVCVAVPLYAHGQVRINEVAWAGDDRSHTNEWIELYNTTGQSIDLSGWSLNAADGSPEIALSGSIGPESYFLLERTDDTATQDASADLMYTGSLSNSGETLVLSDAGGGEIDRISAGENWENIGGDNDTKHTAQYTASGWITAAPTPRSQNASEDVSTNEDESGSAAGGNVYQVSKRESDDYDWGSPTPEVETRKFSDSTTQKTTNNEQTSPRPDFRIEAGGDREVAAGANFLLKAEATPESDFTTYRWNMGNGSVKEGKEVWYRYPRPGRYAVVVSAEDGSRQARDRFIIHAFAADLAVRVMDDSSGNYVAVENNTEKTIDLSRWHLRVGNDFFTLPEDTFVLSEETLAFPLSTLGFSKSEIQSVQLLYPNASLAATTKRPEENVSGGTEQTQSRQRSAQGYTSTQTNVRPSSVKEAPSTLATATDIRNDADQLAAVANTSEDNNSLFKWLFALTLTLLAAAGGIIILAPSSLGDMGLATDSIESDRHSSPKGDIDPAERLAEEFEIIED